MAGPSMTTVVSVRYIVDVAEAAIWFFGALGFS